MEGKDRWFDDDDDKSTAESDLDDLIFHLVFARKLALPTFSTRSLRVEVEVSGHVHLCYPCCLAKQTTSHRLCSTLREGSLAHYTYEAEILRCTNRVSASQVTVEWEKEARSLEGRDNIQCRAYSPCIATYEQ